MATYGTVSPLYPIRSKNHCMHLIVHTFFNKGDLKKKYNFLGNNFYNCQLIRHYFRCVDKLQNKLFSIICNFCCNQSLGHLCKPVLFVNPSMCIHDLIRRRQRALLICCCSNLGLFTLQHTWHFTLLVFGLWGMIGRLMIMWINDSDWCKNVILHMDAWYLGRHLLFQIAD